MLKSALLAIAFLALCRAQTPAPQKGSISGQVVSTTGGGLKKATLRLQQMPATQAGGGGVASGFGGGGTTAALPSLPSVFTTQSDASGNFVFENLDAGRYSLSVDRAGFVRQFAASQPGSTLTLAAGQSLTGVSLKLVPEGTISGRVTDMDGDPFPRARVTLYRLRYSANGRELTPGNTAQTGVDGTYTLEGLTAGTYYVSALDAQANQPFAKSSTKAPEEIYVNTYYPNTLDQSSATPISVAAGAQMRGMDIQMRKTRVFRVHGTVFDVSLGAAPPTSMLRLAPKDATGIVAAMMGSTTQVRNGVFDSGPLPPGDYILQAMPVTTRAADGTMTSLTSVGKALISVGNSDVDNITLQVGPGAEITGKITTEAAAAPAPQGASTPAANAQPRVLLQAIEGLPSSPGTFEAKDAGSFAIHHVPPDKYRASVALLPQGTYVKSIQFGSQDVTRGVIDLSSGAGGALNVVLSPNAATVNGVVRGADGALLPGVSVSLWETAAPSTGLNFAPKSATTDGNGGFKFTGLAPGDYRVLAWEQIDPELPLWPDFREKFSGKAVTVKLNENSQENIEAPLIGHNAIDTAAAQLR